MNNKNKAESLVGIVIGIFILSFILIGMINVIGFSKDISFSYENKIEENLIKSNSENIISKLDTSDLQLEEEFYIKKDTIAKEFIILTGAINKDFAYINKLSNNTSSGSEGKIFERKYYNRIDILRHAIYPTEVPNLVFHFDASNTGSVIKDASNNVSQWNDLSGNNLNAIGGTNKPKLISNAIGEYSGIKFDGINDILKIDSDIKINNDNICSTDLTFKQKSYAIVLRTGDDISTAQIIYEQGANATGYSFSIYQGKIYAGVYNNATVPGYLCFEDSTQVWDSGHKFKSVELSNVIPNTVYFIQIVQDSTHLNTDGTLNDNQNKLQIFLNGNLVLEQNHVDPMPEHGGIGLGGINLQTVYPWNTTTQTCTECDYFDGIIGEFISWNHALSQEEVRGVQNYFVDKWLGGVESVRHNIIETDVSLIK